MIDHMDFDVFVTTPYPIRDGFDADTISTKLQSKDILPIENRGRDVLPFLKALLRLKDYDYACKLHTKRDYEWRGPANHLHDLGWREYMWQTLTDPEVAKGAKEALDDGLGMYAPNTLWYDGRDTSFVNNLKNIDRLAEYLDIELKSETFVAGTMFWFKPSALMWLVDHDLDSLFDEEDGAIDGKMEHAFERCFFQLAEHTNPERLSKEIKIRELSMDAYRKKCKAGELHVLGDRAYRDGNLSKAEKLWKRGAKLGNEQCQINLDALL
jgi:lipopolysaccharide biosynthesis protein